MAIKGNLTNIIYFGPTQLHMLIVVSLLSDTIPKYQTHDANQTHDATAFARAAQSDRYY
jgi:hypothetical protein